MLERKQLRRPWSAVLLGAALLLPAGAQAESKRKAKDAESIKDPTLIVDAKASATFKEGIAAFDRRDFEAARVAFLQTFALKPGVSVVRRNLGLAEIYSGHYLDGARRLARVLHTTEEGNPEDRARMLESLKKAEAHLERVSVEVKQDGAEISIDGVDLGTSPLPFLWYVAPGGYDVNVKKPGYVAFTQSRVARAGAAQHLRIVLDAVPPPAPPPPPVREPVLVDEPESSHPNPWLLIAGGTLAAGALAAGTAFTLAASANSDKVDLLNEQLKRQGEGFNCPQAGERACERLLSAAKKHDQQQLLALGSFITAGVVGGATLLYGLLSGGDDRPERIARPAAQRSKLSAGWDGERLTAVWSGSF
jgi:hypothetical protein